MSDNLSDYSTIEKSDNPLLVWHYILVAWYTGIPRLMRCPWQLNDPVKQNCQKNLHKTLRIQL